MYIRVIKTAQELCDSKKLWEEFIENSSSKAPFFSHTWYDTWWKNFGENKKLFILTAFDKFDKCNGIAPFMISKESYKGLKVREIRFIDNGIGPRNALLISQEDKNYESIKAMISYLAENRNEWDIMNLTRMEMSAPYISTLEKSIKQSNLKANKKKIGESPYLKIENDFDSYMVRNYNSKQRYNIKRRAKQLSKKDGYKLLCVKEIEQIEQALKYAFQVSKSSWKGAIGTDMSCTEAAKSFYMDITRNLAAIDQIRIWILMLKEEPVAVEYQMVDKQTIYLLINDFSEKYRNLSPGISLLYNVVKKYHEDNLVEFDFCGDAYDYKMRWANGIRSLMNLQVYNKNFFSQFLYISINTIWPIMKNLKNIITTN